jgi:inorganic pyrophosphatase
MTKKPTFNELLGMVSRAHPWHGANPETPQFPRDFDCYIEMIAGDEFKRELDKATGILRIDRARRLSSACPYPYGFVPQTYCGNRVAELARPHAGRKRIKGDGDPLDLFVLTTHHLPSPDLLLRARPIGGLRMIDHGEADDKIIAVLDTDEFFEGIHHIDECPKAIIEKVQHYLLSYKRPPGSRTRAVRIAGVYGPEEASQVILASREDYRESFGTPESRLKMLGDQLAVLLAQRKV